MNIAGTCSGVGDRCFEGFTSSYEARICEGVRELGECCFYVARLSKLYLPSSLEKIGDSCFTYFKGEIHYNGSMEHWREIYPTSDDDISSDVKVYCNNGTINE